LCHCGGANLISISNKSNLLLLLLLRGNFGVRGGVGASRNQLNIQGLLS
jgi:hypothetical protein